MTFPKPSECNTSWLSLFIFEVLKFKLQGFANAEHTSHTALWGKAARGCPVR